MTPTLSGTLPLSPLLSDKAQSAFVLDALKTGTLISLSQLCDDDCTAIFNRSEVQILKENKIILTGPRTLNGLWSLPILPPLSHQANGLLRLDQPKRALAQYYHASLGSPVPSTLLRAIRQGHLVSFPGLTTDLISKHLPKSFATVLGHQDQEARNQRSTTVTFDNSPPDNEDLAPALGTRSHHISVMLLHDKPLLKSYSDQTGQFPVVSSSGNHYLFVLYNQDTNYIHAIAIPNRQAATLRDAWETTHKLLIQQGHPPDLHILDNECSQELKSAFQKYKIQFQRVPPHVHRVNAAERAIRTFKNHFVSILCTVDAQYPLSEWDRLLPQALLTLNLLRSSRIHPSLSAHASMFGNYDFNRTPIAPPGTRVVAHVAADTRTPFGEHGVVGWYIGPSPEHYRCWKVYVPETLQERDVLKADFFPSSVPFPSFTRDDFLKQTAEDMYSLLADSPSHSAEPRSPLSFGSPVLNALAKVADILRRAIRPPSHRAIDPLPTPSPATPSLPATPPPLQLPAPVPRVPMLPSPAPLPRSPSVAMPKHVPPLPRVLQPTETPKATPLSTNLDLLRKSPRARLSRLRFDPRTHRRHLAQSIQHDPTVAGKMYNPITGRAENIDSLLRGPDAKRWSRSLTNEWGRCMQGIHLDRAAPDKINGNDTMFFIFPHQVPGDRKVTYAQFVCTMRPGKAEEWRIRMTVGGNLLDAFQDVRSPAISLLDAKLHFNSVISDAHLGARYCTGDLKDFFLQSIMLYYQYMKVHRKYVTPEVFAEYSLTDAHFDSKGYCYLEIRKGMYGLKEAAILAYDQLVAHLAPSGYYPVEHTPGLWRHLTRRTTFTLAVDDFGIKYFCKADADHLFASLATKYELTKDWTGSQYLGFQLDWHYDQGYVDLSMPGYVTKALATLQHPSPSTMQDAPHVWTVPVYGQKTQFVSTTTSPALDKKGTHRVQQICGQFLYYSRGCDPTIITALNEISNQQASPTEKTRAACDMLLDYLATHPLATIRYHASDMVLAICSDAAYLVLPNARSRAAGHFFLTTLASATSSPPSPTSNGAVHILCKTLRTVAASASEAEIGALFLNAQDAIPIRTALLEMGHPQPDTGTPLETDNSTADGILKAQVRLKRSKAFDMRYHWLKCRIRQRQFNLYWAPGKSNSADYFSKHHPPAHHRLMRSQYLQTIATFASAVIAHSASVTLSLRGCVAPSGSSPPGSLSTDHATTSRLSSFHYFAH
jgi:hypothetical protein